MIWVAAVELDGVEEVRKVPGYHDEPYDGHAADEKFSALGAHVSGRSALSQGALTSKVAR